MSGGAPDIGSLAPPGATPPAPAPAPPAPPVLVKNEDGDVFRVPAANAGAMLATKQYQALTPDEIEKHEVHKAEAKKGIVGSLEAAGSSALNQALLGVPEAIESHTDTPAEARRRELVAEEHPTARFLGGAAGFGASLFAGAGAFKAAGTAGELAAHAVLPVEEAAAAGLGRKLAAKAAEYATQGAIISSPVALVHAAFGDPTQAAETLLWGMGLSGALGGAAEIAGEGAGKLADAAAGLFGEGGAASTKLGQLSDTITPKTVGAGRAQLNKLSPERIHEVSEFAHEQGLIQPGMTRQQIGEAIDAAKTTHGARIGEVIDSLDKELGLPDVAEHPAAPAPEAVAPTRTPRTGAEIAAYLKENPEAAARFGPKGELPEDVLFHPLEKPAAVEPGGEFDARRDSVLEHAIKPGEMGAEIRKAFDMPELQMPMNADQARALDLVVESANKIRTTKVNGQDVVTFRDAQNFVSSLNKRWVQAIGRDANAGGMAGQQAVTPVDSMKADAYHVVRNFLNERADQFAAASDNPKLVGELANAKRDYSKVAELDKWAANLERQTVGNRQAGLTDFLHMGAGIGSGVTGSLGAAIGAMLGGAPGALVGASAGKVAGIPLDFFAKKWIENKGMVYLSALARKAAAQGPDVFSAVVGAEGQKRVAASLEAVSNTVRNMALEGTTRAEPRRQEHMTSLLGSTTGLTPDQSYGKLAERVATLATNPAAMVNAAATLSSPYQTAAPKVAEAYQAKLTQAVQYLYGALPKSPEPPKPFAPQTWQPSALEKQAFHQKAEVVANPMAAVRHMQQGTLTDAHIDALQQIYPSTYAKMQQQILEFAASHPEVKLPMQERQSVGKFLGSPLDDVAQHLAALQATYATQPPANQQQQGAGPGEKMPKGKIKNAPSMGTTYSASMGPSPTGS